MKNDTLKDMAISDINFRFDQHFIYSDLIRRMRHSHGTVDLETDNEIKPGMPVNLKYRDNIIRCTRTSKKSIFDGYKWFNEVELLKTEKEQIDDNKFIMTPEEFKEHLLEQKDNTTEFINLD